MKLLLTSAGLTNTSIAHALTELVGKPANETKVGFIPTAANVEKGNKDWFINQLTNLFYKHGFSWIDIIDPSAASVDWRERLKGVDAVFVSGGNTFHLLDQLRKSGLGTWLKENIDSKVYVGVSAGTIVATPSLEVCNIEPHDPNLPGLTDISGLRFVDFEVEPHCDEARFEVIKKYAKGKKGNVYAIDDLTAISVEGGKADVISEGKWHHFAD